MSTTHHDRAQALAKTALALMTERQVAPTPENFQLFYAYVAGDNPASAKVLSELIAARRTLSPQVLSELRDRFFGEGKLEATVQNVGGEITEMVANVLTRLEAAERDAVAYGRTLSAASGELDDATSPAAMQTLVSSLVTATRTMEARTKNLESELQRSSREVSDLRPARRRAQGKPDRSVDRHFQPQGLRRRSARRHRAGAGMGEPLALLMCDIDHFKAFNDTWGHTTGDQVLRLVAGCLSENVKGRDTAARYGGEEFAVILRNTSLADATSLANQIRLFVERKKLVKKSTGDILGTISISIGVAQMETTDTQVLLIQRADTCLYAAKAAGRNCVISDIRPALGDDVVAA